MRVDPSQQPGPENLLRNTIYILLCLIIPAIWGYAASAVYDRINARRNAARNSPGSDEGLDMYHI